MREKKTAYRSSLRNIFRKDCKGRDRIIELASVLSVPLWLNSYLHLSVFSAPSVAKIFFTIMDDFTSLLNRDYDLPQ